MELSPYQIIAPLISVIALLYAWNLVLRQKKSVLEALLWTLFWGGVTLIALFPWILGYLSVLTGIKDQVNAIFVTAIGILFFTVFYLVMRVEELEQRLTKVVRAVALREAGLEKETEESKESKESKE
ncbi:MAG: DUF2304 domain-containing protein [Candidatus Peribacteraceae bacterium]|nr:DUF2304 domain-containing protein [Candidatus Peribacteraceae bacterium]